MANDFIDEWDLGNKSKEDVESGFSVPNGWYRAKISSVEIEKDTSALLLEYQITDGPYRGTKVKDRLMHPKQAKDDNGIKTSTNRRQLVASRLGLLPDSAFGQKSASVNWLQAQGRECIIHVANREYKKNDGTVGKACSPTFDGVYPIGDKRTPASMGGELKEDGTASAAGGVAKAGGNSTTTAPTTPPKKWGTL